MKRLALAALLLVPAAPALFSAKATAPIEIDARIVDGSVEARARTTLDAEVDLEIVQSGASQARRARRPELRVAASPRGDLLVRATVRHGGAVLTRVLSLRTGDEPPRPPVRRNARGEAILEYDR
jgi:hypothetical protein